MAKDGLLGLIQQGDSKRRENKDITLASTWERIILFAHEKYVLLPGSERICVVDCVRWTSSFTSVMDLMLHRVRAHWNLIISLMCQSNLSSRVWSDPLSAHLFITAGKEPKPRSSLTWIYWSANVCYTKGKKLCLKWERVWFLKCRFNTAQRARKRQEVRKLFFHLVHVPLSGFWNHFLSLIGCYFRLTNPLFTVCGRCFPFLFTLFSKVYNLSCSPSPWFRRLCSTFEALLSFVLICSQQFLLISSNSAKLTHSGFIFSSSSTVQTWEWS